MNLIIFTVSLKWNLSLNFDRHPVYDVGRGDTRMAKEEYIRRLAQHLQQQDEDRRLQLSEDQRRSKILKVQPVQRWAELKAWIEEAIKQTNQITETPRLQFANKNINEFSILRKIFGVEGSQSIDIRFNPENGTISSDQTSGAPLMFVPNVQGDGIFFVIAGSRGRSETADEIGEIILRCATGLTGT